MGQNDRTADLRARMNAGKNAPWALRRQHVRTLSALRRRTPSGGLERVLAAMEPEALAFAAQNPEHSEEGRAAAAAALSARIGELDAKRMINGFIDSLPPPGWVSAADIAQGDALFFGVGRWLRRGLGWLAMASIVLWIALATMSSEASEKGFLAAIAAGAITQAEYDESQRSPTSEEMAQEPAPPTSIDKENALRERPAAAPYFAEYRRYDELGQNAMWLCVLIFPFWTIMIGLRQKPARVLLLRRFNDRDIHKSISKLSEGALQPYGHVFTLADKYFRRSWLPLLFSWFSFNPFLLIWRVINIPFAVIRRLSDRSRAGPIMIWSARDYRNFARRMHDRYGLNLEMARTKQNAVMVRTSDVWWKDVVLLLMHAADVIVVDVTEVASGTAWELETMLSEEVAERIVFISRVTEKAQAEASLRSHRFGHAADHLQTYEPSGKPSDPRAFRAAILDAMRRRLAEQHA